MIDAEKVPRSGLALSHCTAFQAPSRPLPSMAELGASGLMPGAVTPMSPSLGSEGDPSASSASRSFARSFLRFRSGVSWGVYI